MNWNTKTTDDKTTITCSDFTIIPCSNGKFQLRRPGALLGTFATLEAAKAKAASLAPAVPATASEASSPEVAPMAKPSKAGRPTGVKHNKLLGFSVCAVAKALGRAGVKFDEADRIMRAHGVTMPKASLSVQLGFGRNPKSWERHGQPAGLTDEQMAELRSTRG
jgi:hypothetical protein